MREDYLAALAKAPCDKIEDIFHPETLIHYAGVARFQRLVQQGLKSREQGIQALLQALHESEGLSAAGFSLRINPEVNDQRGNRTGQLPSVAPREIAFSH